MPVEGASEFAPVTLPAFIRNALRRPRDAALLERVDGSWTPTSSGRLLERVERLACAIRDRAIGGGDRVALMSVNCVDWIVADFAILFAGCVVVPIFPTQASDQVGFILQNSGAKLIFVDSEATAERVRAVAPQIEIVVFQTRGANSLAALEERGGRLRTDHPDRPRIFEAALAPDDLAILIYTSGTTGEPKGVMLSHNNIAFNARSSFSRAFDVITPGSDVLSVLTFSHIYEHMILYGYMFTEVRHHITRAVEDLLEDLRSVRPITMTAVPRIFERVIAGIVGRAKAHGGLQAKLVPWALSVGRAYATARTRGRRAGPLLGLRYRIANALVLRKIRPVLGLDRLKFFVSGSAPLHFDTAMVLLGCGIAVVEGYGPTECSPVITVNTHFENHYGTVGRPIPGVEIRIAPDGEVLARGPGVMLGYYRNEAATAQAMRDGWYHTGDVGDVDGAGYLRITDRKNELFKTSGGKFIAPSRIEAAIKRSVYVNQVLVVGESRAHPIALISPNWDVLRTDLALDAAADAADLMRREDVVATLTREVRKQTADLAPFEQVRRIALLPRELTIEAGELSPTLKVKRRVVENRYAPQIERAYAAEVAAS